MPVLSGFFSFHLLISKCSNLSRTGQYGSALALFFHAALLLARDGEGHFEDKAANVVTLLKVRLSVPQLLLLQVGSHVGHLDVCVLGVQVFGVNLRKKAQASLESSKSLARQEVKREQQVVPSQSLGSSSRSLVQTCRNRA